MFQIGMVGAGSASFELPTVDTVRQIPLTHVAMFRNEGSLS